MRDTFVPCSVQRSHELQCLTEALLQQKRARRALDDVLERALVTGADIVLLDDVVTSLTWATRRASEELRGLLETCR